jgi:aspartate-semialdehyde dehydrogenase
VVRAIATATGIPYNEVVKGMTDIYLKTGYVWNDKKGIEMFVSGDQLLRGAALNAVEIAEHLIKRGFV